MKIIPHSFNGFLFQQDDKVASDWDVPFSWNVSGISAVNTPKSQDFPEYVSKNYNGSIKVINVTITANINQIRDDLMKAADVTGEDQHPLIGLDELGRSWYLNAICNTPMNVQTIDEFTLSAGVAFEVDNPTWRKYEPSTQTILVSGGTGAGTITPLGNQPAYPIIKITPTGAGSFGFLYKRFVQIVNNSENALNSYPINLTGAGLDTAALVTAGKMLSSGNDLRIYVDGVEVKRWLQGMNTTTTKIWINWTQPANSNMTLGAAIAAVGDISTMTIENTPANVALLAIIPTSGNILIGSEIFVYTGVDTVNLQLTGITRAERQTSAGAHSTGATIKFVTHDVWIYYGYPSIAAYVVDDSHKPIISLTSTNTSHIYASFGANSGLRSGGWTKFKSSANTIGDVFTSSYGGSQPPFVNPPSNNATNWTVMGEAALYSFDGLPYTLEFKLYNPIGAVTVTSATGRKYRKGTAWNTITFEKSSDGITYTVVWTEATPAVATVWEDLDTHSAVGLATTNFYLKFKMYEVPIAPPPEMIKVQEIQDFTVALDSARAPTINVAAESAVLNLHAVFENAANGLQMIIDLTLVVNTYLTVNTSQRTITLFDGSNQIAALIDMPVRANWFPFVPNEPNEITITEDSQATFEFSWEDGSL